MTVVIKEREREREREIGWGWISTIVLLWGKALMILDGIFVCHWHLFDLSVVRERVSEGGGKNPSRQIPTTPPPPAPHL